jgi:hypothetical protein
MLPYPTIPEMTNPLGKHWEQPDRSQIKFALGKAWVSKEDFAKLKQYDVTNPSGVYEGKMWKSVFHRKGKYGMIKSHLLMWYAPSKKEGFCDVKRIELMIE